MVRHGYARLGSWLTIVVGTTVSLLWLVVPVPVAAAVQHLVGGLCIGWCVGRAVLALLSAEGEE